MNEIIQYIENELHTVFKKKQICAEWNLPNYYKFAYKVEMYNNPSWGDCVFLAPKTEESVLKLSYHIENLKNLTNRNCVLILDEISNYKMKQFIEKEIPFVVQGRQIYMPFIGVSLKKNKLVRR
ncbi:MAG: hypothetical protein ACRCUS_03130, partial [Anaerovoracaceae bacterium]